MQKDIFQVMKEEYPSYDKLVYKYNFSEEDIKKYYESINLEIKHYKLNLEIIKQELNSFNYVLDMYNVKYEDVSSIISEIQGSAAIEGVHSSKKAIEKIINKKEDNKVQEIFNLVQAYKYIKLGKEINNKNIKELYDILMTDIDLKENALDGKYYRKEAVEISSSNQRVVAKGIDAKDIQKEMDILFSFVQSGKENDGLYEYIKAFIIHYMFVYIHPYYDGNGRMARLISQWSLFNENIEYTLPISEIIKYDKVNYYNAIQNTRESYVKNDLTYFLKYMLIASKKLMEVKLIAINYCYELMNKEIILSDSEVEYLIMILLNYKEDKFDHKKFNSLLKVTDSEKSKEGALKILNKLVDQKVLKAKIVKNTKLYELCDEIKNKELD